MYATGSFILSNLLLRKTSVSRLWMPAHRISSRVVEVVDDPHVSYIALINLMEEQSKSIPYLVDCNV
ncbi:hypothetical protein GCK32_006537 [Trichostrongylus colubriformis]|uniref:Uncharacterized protein n=1 Tax=Trichostrongylus colubriformis TaxID=6319 RepID=A0AAN8FEF3_TRICO